MEHSPANKIARRLRWLAIASFLFALAASVSIPALRTELGVAVSLLVSGDVAGLEAWAGSFGPLAPMATGLLMVVQALAAPIPAVFVTWANSLLFGPFLGGLWSILTATLAAWICFGLARFFGEPLVARMLPAATLERTNAFIERHGVTAVLVARLVPIVPFDPISYAAGLTRMRGRVFLLATFLGQIPAGMTYSYLGQEITSPARFLLLGTSAFLALLLVGLAARRVLLGRDHEEAAGGGGAGESE